MTSALTVSFEHASTTVPDLAEAEAFFVGVLGARVRSRARFAGPGVGNAQNFDMAETFNAHPDATAQLVSLELGGVVVELFAYTSPDQSRARIRNCDVDGHHLGFRVGDLQGAVETLKEIPGVTVLGEPNWGVTGAGVRRGWVYFLTPWGLQLELSEENP